MARAPVRVPTFKLRAPEQRAAPPIQDRGAGSLAETAAHGLDRVNAGIRATRRAAIQSYVAQLEVTVEGRSDAIILAHQDDPAAMQAAFKELRTELGGNVIDDARPQFDLILARAEQVGLSRAGSIQAALSRDAAKADVRAQVAARRRSIERAATTLGFNPLVEGLIDAQMEELSALLVQNGPKGAFEFRGRQFEADPTRSGAFSVQDIQREEEQARIGVGRTIVNRDILIDPDLAVSNLAGGIYDVSEADRFIFLNRAVGRSQSRRAARLAEQTRVEKLQKQAEKTLQEDTAKEGYALLSEGRLTAEWIDQNSDNLRPADVKFFFGDLGGASGTTDAELFADLRVRAGDGEDVREEAVAALNGRRLTIDDFNTIVGRVEGADKLPSDFRRFDNLIARSLRVSDLVPSAGGPQREAQAREAFAAWFEAHPDASTVERRREAEAIIKDFSVVKLREINLTMGTPRFLVGDRNNPDLAATKLATVAAFKSGDLDEAELARQARLIEDWEAAVERMRGAGVGNGAKPAER